MPREDRKKGMPLCFYPYPVISKAKELMARADALFQREKYEDAAVITDELVKTVPLMAHVWAYRAFAAGTLKRGRDAMKYYETAISLGYPTAAAYYNLGYLYENSKRYDEALKVYMEGLFVEHDYEPLKARAAELAYAYRKYGMALALFEEIVEQNPGNQAAMKRVAELRAMKGRI